MTSLPRRMKEADSGSCSWTDASPIPETINTYGSGVCREQAELRYYLADLLGRVLDIRVHLQELTGARRAGKKFKRFRPITFSWQER